MNAWHVITGGPSSGKTTLLAELERRGHATIPEAARIVIDDGLAKGMTLAQVRGDERAFQLDVFRMKIQIEAGLDQGKPTFFDRGMHDTVAYFKLHAFDITDEIRRAVGTATYQTVFLLDPLPLYEQDYARTEPPELIQRLHRLLLGAYADAGMQPIAVSAMPVPERAAFVLSHVQR